MVDTAHFCNVQLNEREGWAKLRRWRLLGEKVNDVLKLAAFNKESTFFVNESINFFI